MIGVVIVCAAVMHMIGAVSGSSAASDHLALLEIKAKITHDPRGALTSWNDSLHFCKWRGVTCGRRHRRVTFLNLRGNSLVGSLSSHLGNMSFLGYVTLDNNQLHGSIPPEIRHLHRLKVLSLFNNSLTGEIPANMSSWPKLSHLNLESNKLSGKIPNTFSSKLMINMISFADNDLTGGIPPFLGNLMSLEILYLTDCPLGGSIPDSFNQLKNLQQIGLGENDLVGAFPSFISNFSMLEILSFPENHLHGTLPSNICLSQPHLTNIELGSNRLSGFLTPSISNCLELETLDVGENDLKGKIAIDFGRLQHLSILFLGGNNFGGKDLDDINFFHSLSNCSNLAEIELTRNQLKGTLPNSLGNFSSKLSYLVMASNYISGNVPSSIGNLLGLTTLSLGPNNFIGLIPESIGKLQNLQILYLDNNHFSGVIPRSIGNLSRLTKLTLGRNNLKGTIPPTIGSCKKLIGLDLQGNKLSGSVPKELFQLSSLSIGLDLSKNNLSGELPQQIGNLKNAEELDFSMNSFVGELPSSLSTCGSLQKLNLSGNFFYGSFPEAFSSLKGLEDVDLSHNNFYGHIPTYLQQKSLKHLDLSYNKFEGEVPVNGVFSNISAISVIGNTRLCGGPPGLHLPKCITTISDSKRRSGKLSVHVIVAISLSSTVAGLGLLAFILFYCCIKKKLDKPSELGLVEPFEKISYRRLLKATEGFSSENLIGTGSFASVYKGVAEYGLGNEVSTSGDMYSYGILLLEMLTGKKPIDPMFEGGLGLHSYARSALEEGFVLQIVDPMLLDEDVNERSLISFVKIGVQCSYESPQDRMDIGSVVHELFATTVAT